MSGFMNGLAHALGLARSDAPSRTPTPSGYTWQTMGGGNRIGQHDTFDNVFPYVNAIAQRFSTLTPYAIDSNGQRITPTPAPVAALYQPNDTFSAREFLRFIATSVLTQSHLDVLIWTGSGSIIIPGGNITLNNIAGYTFLPQSSRQYNDNRTDWYHRVNMTINGQPGTYEFTRDETIALTYAKHPEDPTRGISPAMTVQKWATVDDMIADYQRGFFGNGAVPAGMLSIVSADADDFRRNKNRIEDTFRGAGNSNSVIYNMVPIDPVTRQPTEFSKITWVPFQQSNDQLDLATVNSVVNNRLASAMAVPDIVRGIDNGQTYANAEMAERSFIENTLQPLALTIWDKWQFELDRITGGLGYGITFDLDLPAQTDVEQIQAQTQSTKVQTLIALVNAGANPSDAARALCLPDAFANLTLRPTQQAAPVTPTLTIPAQHEHRELARDLTDREKQAYENGLEHLTTFYESIAQIARRSRNGRNDDLNRLADAAARILGDDYRGELLRFASANGRTLLASLRQLAQNNHAIAALLDEHSPAEWSDATIMGELTGALAAEYGERLQRVMRSSARSAYEGIQSIIDKANADDATDSELNDRIHHYVSENRAPLMALNELTYAQRFGSFAMAQKWRDDFKLTIVSTWVTAEDRHVCPFCRWMAGREITVGDEVFMDMDSTVNIEGKDFVNDFEPLQVPPAHGRCRCAAVYRVTGRN